jgi:hypothetical protein
MFTLPFALPFTWETIVAILVAIMTMLRGVAEVLTYLGNKLNKPEFTKVAQYIGTALYWIGKIVGLFGIGIPSTVLKIEADKLNVI